MSYPDLLTSLTPRGACEHLYDLASKVPKTQVIVELGVYRARTTVWMAAGAQAGRGAHLYAIDPWDHPAHDPLKPKFGMSKQREIAEAYVVEQGHTDHVTLTQGFSAQVGQHWDGPKVGLLYVDGDHTYEGVMADWDAWSPHLVGTATVVWDDYLHPSHPGVRKAVDALVQRGDLTGMHVVADRIAVTRLPRGRHTPTRTTPPPNPEGEGTGQDQAGQDTEDPDPDTT